VKRKKANEKNGRKKKIQRSEAIKEPNNQRNKQSYKQTNKQRSKKQHKNAESTQQSYEQSNKQTIYSAVPWVDTSLTGRESSSGWNVIAPMLL
jgi:hypothetical protein